MTDKEQLDTTAHQQEYELKQQDALDIALLANVVGRELTQVDKFAVNGMQKATRISQEKIFNKSPTATQQQVPVQPQPVTQAPPPPPPELQQLKKVTKPVDVVPQQQQNMLLQPNIQPIINNTQFETLTNNLSSLNIKIDKLQDTYEQILDKIVSKAKTITFTVDDKNR